MADFTQLIKSGNTQKAYLKRWAILNQINKNVLLIQGLDSKNPDSTTFNRLESEANRLLQEYKIADRELDIHLAKANHDINNDEYYKADQKLARDQQFFVI